MQVVDQIRRFMKRRLSGMDLIYLFSARDEENHRNVPFADEVE